MKSPLKTLRLTLLACASYSCYSVQAQPVSVLDKVVTTATRNESKSDTLVSEVIVINRAQIEAAGGSTLGELLSREAGVQFSSNGGLGKTTGIFIRGAEARHTMLLIDGVRFGSATTGTPTFENIPLEAIERIEILKGPGSALYGSDGVGGVVQIFTRAGTSGLIGSASLTAGSHSYTRLSAELRAGTDRLTYAIGAQKVRDGGFSATNSKVPFGNFNSDRDGFSQTSVNGSIRWSFVPDWSLTAKVLRADGKNQFDDGPVIDTRANISTAVFTTGVEGRVAANWKTNVSYSISNDRYKQTSSASTFVTIPSIFNTKQTQFGWKNDVKTPFGTALVGVERLTQSVASSTRYTVDSRTVNSAYLGLNGTSEQHSWQANVRSDKNSQFGQNTTAFVGYGFAITPQWRVSASHGTSFVAPTFNQLYFPSFGNPSLQPEKGKNTDIGLSYTDRGQSVKLIHFENNIRGYISNTTLASNIPRATIEGWTLGYDGRLGPIALRASYDLLDPKNELTGKQLARRSRNQLSVGADYDFGVVKLSGQLLSVGSRFDNAANTVTLNSYTTVDLMADYRVAKDWTLQARINNLTNKEFETALGYNQPARSVFVTLRFHPK